MTTLAERNFNPRPGNGGGPQSESWGLLLIPVLLCVGMFIYAMATTALPAPPTTPSSRPCVSAGEPRPTGGC